VTQQYVDFAYADGLTFLPAVGAPRIHRMGDLVQEQTLPEMAILLVFSAISLVLYFAVVGLRATLSGTGVKTRPQVELRLQHTEPRSPPDCCRHCPSGPQRCHDGCPFNSQWPCIHGIGSLREVPRNHQGDRQLLGEPRCHAVYAHPRIEICFHVLFDARIVTTEVSQQALLGGFKRSQTQSGPSACLLEGLLFLFCFTAFSNYCF
jgi:hypothetical protein